MESGRRENLIIQAANTLSSTVSCGGDPGKVGKGPPSPGSMVSPEVNGLLQPLQSQLWLPNLVGEVCLIPSHIR